MTNPRTPRSVFYDGAVYGRLVEPLLAGVHGFVAENLPPGDRVLEACCGTGSLARTLASRGRSVIGVDLSPRNISYAKDRSERDASLEFEVGDVSALRVPSGGRYDVATIVLALHEMPRAARVPVARALLRVADRVMIVDFAVPMPRNRAGLRNRTMEILAGRNHFAAFRDYSRQGGLSAITRELDCKIERKRHIDAGTLDVLTLVRAIS